MNGFDLIIFAIVGVFAAIGAWRGLLREVISMVAWVSAAVLAWLYAAPVARIFARVVQDAALRQLLAFVLIFAVIFTLGMVISWLIHKYLPPKRAYRTANIALGFFLGAARGAVIVIAFFLVAGLTPIPQRDWWRDSICTPYFERAAVYVAGYIPRDIARHLRYG